MLPKPNATPIIIRFAPSPTGYLHMGGARTALFNHLFAKQNGGKAILRIEDTDKQRSTKEYETSIIESLKWLGLQYDEIVKQSDREVVYKGYLKRLIDEGKAYVSKEDISAPTAPSTLHTVPLRSDMRAEVIRFKNPNKKVTFFDLIRGEVEFDTTELKDFVIAKSMEEPLYHLAVVVDDFEMGITHVIRGEDHISNTPRQILIQEAIGAPRPIYAHLPIILATDKSKLSKRKHGESVSVDFYRRKGYLPEAVINFLALLGWNPGNDQEIFSIDELVKTFDMSKVQKSGAVFNVEKLDWLNKQYIAKLSDTDIADHSKAFIPEWLTISSPTFKRLLPLLREKISTFGEITDLFSGEGELRFAHDIADYPAGLLLWKKEPDAIKAREHLTKVKKLLTAVPDESASQFTAEAIKSALWSYAEANGKGNVLWPLRVALTGQEKSPDPFVSVAILGKTEALKRIDTAIGML
jgi:glutamyl-tRNA synthetase